MHVTKYLCIDDQRADIIDPLLGRLSNERIEISRATPREISAQVQLISDFIDSCRGHPAGVLLDLRIDMEADTDGLRVAYRGPALAQELRTRMVESSLKPVPVVLWSVNTKFQRSFSTDESSHDLFDAVYDKDARVSSDPLAVAQELISLAEGYQRIQNEISTLGPAHLIGLDDARSAVYKRFLAEYEMICSRRSTHEIARFLLDALVRREGLLVGESTLAARLGVDRDASGSKWHEFKELIGKTAYAGPFASAWPRWWWFQVEDWWSSCFEGRSDLRRLQAHERVERITALSGIELTPAKTVLSDYSTKFFTTCVATKIPLDPVDGFRVMSIEARDWHDTRYVSIHAALERIAKSEWTIDPLDRDRFDLAKEAHTHGKEV